MFTEIYNVLSTVNSLLRLVDTIQVSRRKMPHEVTPKRPSVDAWTSMMFQQSGPARTFPRMAAKRVNLASHEARDVWTRRHDDHDSHTDGLPW